MLTKEEQELLTLMDELVKKATAPYPRPLPEQPTRAAEAAAGKMDQEAVRKWRAETDAAKQRITNLMPKFLEMVRRRMNPNRMKADG